MRTKRCTRALALLVGVGALVSLPLAGRDVGSASSGVARACAWTVERPKAELTGVHANAQGVWLTGSLGGKGVVLRRSGAQWSPTVFPSVTAIVDIASEGQSAWAVGVRQDGSGIPAGEYVFRQNGQRWSRVRVPGLPKTKLGLAFTAVDVRNGDVWLAGTWAKEGHSTDKMVDPGGSGWLAARLHAGRWHADAGSYSEYAELYEISAHGARDAWAVGHSGPTMASAQEVMLHWNGSRWVDMSRYDFVYGLASVLALDRNDAWAVGSTNLDAFEDAWDRPAIEHWNGKHWARVPMPSWHWRIPPQLSALTAFGRRDVWAGGARFNGAPTLVHWDGSQWREATAPPVKTGIVGLAAARDGTLWAAGTGFVAHARCS